MEKMILRNFLIIISIIICEKTSAQKCKTDYSKVDMISKQAVNIWKAPIFQTSLSNLSGSTYYVYLNLLQEGDSSYIALLIQVEEYPDQVKTPANFKAEKGNTVYLGTMEGTPISFTADAVTNNKQVIGAVTGQTRLSVTLVSSVKPDELNILKDMLTQLHIDAFRVILSNGVTVENQVKEKNANLMIDKANCFFDYLKDKGYMK